MHGGTNACSLILSLNGGFLEDTRCPLDKICKTGMSNMNNGTIIICIPLNTMY